MNLKKVLVLGGSGSIGKAVTKQLSLNTNYKILSTSSNDLDLSSEHSISTFSEKHGKNFDIIVIASGINNPKLFETLSSEEIQKVLEVNSLGFLQLIQRNIPHWKNERWGRVVVVSSLYGIFARKGRFPYVVSKHALIGAMKTLSIEFAEFGVLVNSVSPGFIQTEMTFKNNSADQIKKIESGIPLGRLGVPEDIATAVEFLISEKNQYITGHDLIIDGGYSVGGFQS